MKKKHSFFLKLIIIEKLFLGILFTVLGLGLISMLDKDAETYANRVVEYLNLDIEKAYVQAFIDWWTNVKDETIIGMSAGMFVLGVLGFVEAYGLHLRRRWAEWLTVIATSLFIPLELYEVVQKQTLLRIGALVINVAIVYYLAKHKELFPKKRFRLTKS